MNGINKDNRQMLRKIAWQCGPVIQGVKPANLLIVSTDEIRGVIAFFSERPLMCFPLYHCTRWTTFIVLNEGFIKQRLEDEENWGFMQERGYKEQTLEKVLSTLKERYEVAMMRKEGFPHEIGILLGYPLSDVKAFITFNGEKYLLVGYWKVYSHVDEALTIFSSYDLAKEKTIRWLMNKK